MKTREELSKMTFGQLMTERCHETNTRYIGLLKLFFSDAAYKEGFERVEISTQVLKSYTCASGCSDYSEVIIRKKGVLKKYFGKKVAIYVADKWINGAYAIIYVKEI